MRILLYFLRDIQARLTRRHRHRTRLLRRVVFVRNRGLQFSLLALRHVHLDDEPDFRGAVRRVTDHARRGDVL